LRPVSHFASSGYVRASPSAAGFFAPESAVLNSSSFHIRRANILYCSALALCGWQGRCSPGRTRSSVALAANLKVCTEGGRS
jgi:hypothetical protein